MIIHDFPIKIYHPTISTAQRLQVGGHIVRHQGPHTLRSNAGGGQQHTAASHGLCNVWICENTQINRDRQI